MKNKRENMGTITVTSKEFMKQSGLSTQRSYELRNGQRHKRKDGTYYQSKPLLIEGRDFMFKRGRLYYNEDLIFIRRKGGRKKCEPKSQ